MSRYFSNWIEGYEEYTQLLEAPAQFHRWTAISVIAGALGRKVWFEQHYYRWAPNFYIIFVAAPAICNKSTTANVGHSLLRELGIARYGPNSLTWQALISWMTNNGEEVLMPDGMMIGMSQMNIVASELGSLVNPADFEMIDILTDLWDGHHTTWEKMTKTGGHEIIPNPWINIIAGTTPAWLSGRVPRHMIDGGLFSRIIFVFAEKKRHRRAYQELEVEGGPRDVLRRALVRDLEQISTLRGIYQLDAGGLAYGTEWYNRHQDRVEARDPLYEMLGTYVSRKQTHLHKIAMAIAAAHRDELIITANDLEMADRLLTHAEQDMNRVYQLASEDPIVASANVIVDVLRKHRRIPYDMLYRMVYSRMNFETFGKAVMDAVQAHRVRLIQNGTVRYIELIGDEDETTVANPS